MKDSELKVTKFTVYVYFPAQLTNQVHGWISNQARQHCELFYFVPVFTNSHQLFKICTYASHAFMRKSCIQVHNDTHSISREMSQQSTYVLALRQNCPINLGKVTFKICWPYC